MDQTFINEVSINEKRRIGKTLRSVELQRLGIEYVLKRDDILRRQGLDPLIDAFDYEQNRKKHANTPISKLTEFEFQPSMSPNGAKIEKLLETVSPESVIHRFIEEHRPADFPPVFDEISHGDPEDSELQILQLEFDEAYRQFCLDFLRRRATKISRKALIRFAAGGSCDVTFDRIL